MKRLLRYAILLIGVLGMGGCTMPSLPLSLPAPTTASMAIDPFLQNEQLGRGINLGNTLEAPQEGEWGLTVDDAFFPTIANAGFDSVRIPIRWNAHAAAEPPYTIEASFFARVDHVVEQALDEGLLVVLNVHHYEELMANPADHRDRFLALWSQIARHYQDAPPDVLFEILNEPNAALTESLWNEILGEAIATIRQTNPMRNLIVGPGSWYAINSLARLELPEDDHLIVSIHYYQPFQFTHQGAEWVTGSTAWLGATWEGQSLETQAVDFDLERAARWAETNNRPLYLGEFGAYSKADMASRVRWTAYVARKAEEMAMSWAYWEFASGFGAYDAGARRWRPQLLDALIPGEE